MNKVFISLFFILLIVLGAGISAYFYSTDFDSLLEGNEEKETIISEEIRPEEVAEKTNEDIVREKIELIRSRHALKGLILEGDSHYSSGDLGLALSKYREFYKQNPDDPLIIEKLGDTYMSMHKYESAHNYYKKIENNTSSKYINNLFYLTDFSNSGSINSLVSTIEELDLSDEETYYYTNSAKCSLDFHACKKDFGEYFWPEEKINSDDKETQDSDSPSEISNEITFGPLYDIKTAIQNYRNFRIDDVSLKDTYIISQWYKHGLYPLAIHISNTEILPERPDYKPVLKILAESYYEMGKYESARETLNSYNEIEDGDANVVYTLGLINTQLRDYVLANIHFNRSIKLGLEQSILARRQLIHNFYVLKNYDNMLREFRELIRNEEGYNQNDASLAIYNHILQEEYDWPLEIMDSVKEKFPEFGNIYAYEGWIYRQQGDLEKARSILEQGNAADPDNPFILINLGYTYKQLELKGASLISFKKVISVAPESEFAHRAEQEIQEL